MKKTRSKNSHETVPLSFAFAHAVAAEASQEQT
jgi:hypothetical protein